MPNDFFSSFKPYGVKGTGEWSPANMIPGVNPGMASGATGLATGAAQENLAAAPGLEKLSSLINQINTQASIARGPGGQAAWDTMGKNVQRGAEGLLDQGFLDTLKSGIAANYVGRGGFGVDTNALNAAALRGMGEEIGTRQRNAVQDYATLNSTLPQLYDVSRSMVTPELYETAQQHQAQNALEREALAQAQNQWEAEFGQQGEQFQQTLAQQKEELAAQMGLSYAQLSQQQKEFVDTLAQRQAEQAQQESQYSRSQAQQGAQFQQTLAQQKEALAAQMGLSYAQLSQQQKEFVDTLAQRQAEQAQQGGQFQQTLAQQQKELAAKMGLSYADLARQIQESSGRLNLGYAELAQGGTQFGQSLGQRQSEYDRTLAQQQAEQEARTALGYAGLNSDAQRAQDELAYKYFLANPNWNTAYNPLYNRGGTFGGTVSPSLRSQNYGGVPGWSTGGGIGVTRYGG